MKKKSVIITGAILLVLVLCLTVFFTKGLSFRVGRCMVTEDGRVLLLMEGSPVSLSDHTPLGTVFARCHTGDVALVLHDGVQETFPGGTACYMMIRLQQGSSADSPAPVLNALDEMGWTVKR